jgi:chromate reductase
MRALAISGSLRSHSTNTSLLQALILLAPPNLQITLYHELHRIPPFNPDYEHEGNTGPIARFRSAIQTASVVLFSTPEYAHGVPGALKNALDWIVGTGELSRKPVVLINASARGTFAQASLREILTTMDATLLHDAEVILNLPRNLTPTAIAATPEYAASLNTSLQKIAQLHHLS